MFNFQNFPQEEPHTHRHGSALSAKEDFKASLSKSEPINVKLGINSRRIHLPNQLHTFSNYFSSRITYKFVTLVKACGFSSKGLLRLSVYLQYFVGTIASTYPLRTLIAGKLTMLLNHVKVSTVVRIKQANV